MTPGHAGKPCVIFAVTVGAGIEKVEVVVTDLGAEMKTLCGL